MKVGESVNDYFARTLTIANKMRIHGEQMGDVVVIEKILRSMTPKFDYVVCSIGESNDIDKIIVSQDVFEEDQSWDWAACYKEAIVADLEWEIDEGEGTEVGDNEEESEASSTKENEGSEETNHGVAQEDLSHEEIDENSPHEARTR
ncbi:hypothetical protein F0562_005567 [Nyssa sinensis]|uniref:Uncharacterized protein n=1 Tax=Nyssa sinensis TaxID=561372 RepID=A0A5J5AKX6_9ASTE|nr:hypothetical protein F0562_005567 [Nyssa sinensis]